MNKDLLELFYEKAILPNYDEFDSKNITWKDHGKISDDSWAHYFDCAGKKYVLVFEDFPGEVSFDDGLSHNIIKAGDKTSLRFGGDSLKYAENITGYFTLFREKVA